MWLKVLMDKICDYMLGIGVGIRQAKSGFEEPESKMNFLGLILTYSLSKIFILARRGLFKSLA